MEFGLNYQARDNFNPIYLTDAELSEDFDLFESQGINHVTVVAYWDSLEPILGQYDITYLNRLIRFIDYANFRGFKVSFDTHVHMIGSQGAPQWFQNYGNRQINMTNVFNEPMRTQWIALHEWLSQNLGNKLYSIQAWNEPYLSGDAQNPDEFVQLFSELRDAWRSHSTSKFTIRTSIYGLHQFWDYQEFYRICDYISINFYPNRYSGHTYSNLLTALEKLSARGKSWMFGEFGYDSPYDQEQYDGLANAINETIQQIANANMQMPTMMNMWIWLRATQPDYMEWSLCDVDGNPRPAFNLLTSTPPPPPPGNLGFLILLLLLATAFIK